MSIPGCKHSVQDQYIDGASIRCRECEKQQKDAEKRLVAGMYGVTAVKTGPQPTCTICGNSLGTDLQSWLLGVCSGQCMTARELDYSRRGIKPELLHTIIMNEAYDRFKPFWSGNS